MARRKKTSPQIEDHQNFSPQTSYPALDTFEDLEVKGEDSVPSDPDEGVLVSEFKSHELKAPQSKESIEAAIQERLSNRNQEGKVDPFVPSSQLQNEVKQVAKLNGFPLSRGTEAGAALMARARRRSST